MAVILLAVYIDKIRRYPFTKKQDNGIELSGYTPDQLIHQCNEDFNDPHIYWPTTPVLNFQTMQQNFDFIMRCIMSCQNEWQLKIVYNMIERFHALYADAKDLYDQLMDVILTKQSMIN